MFCARMLSNSVLCTDAQQLIGLEQGFQTECCRKSICIFVIAVGENSGFTDSSIVLKIGIYRDNAVKFVPGLDTQFSIGKPWSYVSVKRGLRKTAGFDIGLGNQFLG